MATIPEALAIAIRHYQAGRLQAAEQTYRKILAVEPNLAEVHGSLGLVLREEGKLDEAIACFRRALKLKPGDIQANMEVDYEEAVADLEGVARRLVTWCGLAPNIAGDDYGNS